MVEDQEFCMYPQLAAIAIHKGYYNHSNGFCHNERDHQRCAKFLPQV